MAPFYHRKFWEYCYVCQVLFAEGKLAPEQSGLGFGCGVEPLPSLFVKYGARVLATDLDRDHTDAEAWQISREHGASAEALRHRDICADEERLADIDFRPVDMNAIPRDLDGQFDFCWSTCAFEHLGTLANGLAFVENSLRTLRPGGVAVHTTEFTFNCGETIDNNPTVLYQERHLIELIARLRDQGYQVADLDLSPGSGVLDCFVDLPPFSHDLLLLRPPYAHLKLAIDGYTCTSVGLIIKVCGFMARRVEVPVLADRSGDGGIEPGRANGAVGFATLRFVVVPDRPRLMGQGGWLALAAPR